MTPRCGITIAYVTGRPEPMLGVFVDSIAPQLQPGEVIELVLVDFYGRSCDELGARLPPGLVVANESKPKPCVWQGEGRIATRDYWAMSNARNTALILCETDYIAFLDDRCELSPGWLPAVRKGERERASVKVGPYDKLEARGLVPDHRTAQAATGRVNIGGGWLFGGNFCLPLAWALEVNGFEEGCDTVGGEDYIFGQMLENAGRRIEFDPGMHVQQDRAGVDHPFPRWDKGVSPRDKSHAMNARFGKRTRTELTPDLIQLRAAFARGESFPRPDPAGDHRDWYDGQHVREF